MVSAKDVGTALPLDDVGGIITKEYVQEVLTLLISVF